MPKDSDIADDLIPGGLKRSKSYHGSYGDKSYGEIKDLAAANPPDQKARQMKKLIEQTDRLQGKGKGGGHDITPRVQTKAVWRSKLYESKDYDAALIEVDRLLESWPGNAHLHVLWASLVQLQDDPKHGLEEAKQALQQAVELDRGSPAAAIELGHFLDNVEDDPLAASKIYAEGVAAARQLLIDGLIGQAKALQQLDKREEFLRCLLEILHLTRVEGPKQAKSEEVGSDIIFESPAGHFHAIQLKGPYSGRIRDLLGGEFTNRSA